MSMPSQNWKEKYPKSVCEGFQCAHIYISQGLANTMCCICIFNVCWCTVSRHTCFGFMHLCNYVGEDKVNLWGISTLKSRLEAGHRVKMPRDYRDPQLTASQCHLVSLSYRDNRGSSSRNMGFTLIEHTEGGHDLPSKTSWGLPWRKTAPQTRVSPLCVILDAQRSSGSLLYLVPYDLSQHHAECVTPHQA